MWLELAFAVVTMIISTAITMALQEKPKPPTAGTLDVPTAEEGGTITVIFGTVRVKNANVVWYGNPRQVPIKSEGGKK